MLMLMMMMMLVMMMMIITADDDLAEQDLEVNNRQLLSNTERMRTELDRVVQVIISIMIVVCFSSLNLSGAKPATGKAAGVHEAPRGVHCRQERACRPSQHVSHRGKEGGGLCRSNSKKN